MKKLQREEGQGILLNKRTKQEKAIIKETNLQIIYAVFYMTWDKLVSVFVTISYSIISCRLDADNSHIGVWQKGAGPHSASNWVMRLNLANKQISEGISQRSDQKVVLLVLLKIMKNKKKYGYIQLPA